MQIIFYYLHDPSFEGVARFHHLENMRKEQDIQEIFFQKCKWKIDGWNPLVQTFWSNIWTYKTQHLNKQNSKKKKKKILVKEMTIQLVAYFINHISFKKISYRFKETISTWCWSKSNTTNWFYWKLESNRKNNTTFNCWRIVKSYLGFSARNCESLMKHSWIYLFKKLLIQNDPIHNLKIENNQPNTVNAINKYYW